MTNAIDDNGNETLMVAAFERVKPELLALEADELIQVSLDIPAAVAIVIGVLPEAKALRGEIVKHLPTFEIERFDKLEDYAWALSHAHGELVTATHTSSEFEPLVEEATKVREKLLAEARWLIHHGIVNAEQLQQLRGANGYKNVAADLVSLVGLMQRVWPAIDGKTLTTAADLEAASRLAQRVIRAIGIREQGSAPVAEVTDLRLRAYTMLLTVYDDTRRAIQYLRSKSDDADDIAPPLHPGRPKRRKSEPEVTTPPSPPAAVVPANGSSAHAVTASSISENGPFLS